MPNNTFTLSWLNFAHDTDYPTTGAADTLYTNSANDVVKYWDGSAYSIYVGPHPHH